MDAVLQKCVTATTWTPLCRSGLDGPGRQRSARRHNKLQHDCPAPSGLGEVGRGGQSLVPLEDQPREERQRSFPKRAAFALVTAKLTWARPRGPTLRTLRQWTHSWCEACSLRLFNAVCTLCDADHLVCRPCQRLGRSWEAARAANTTPPDCIELNGYRDQTGRFVQVDPPLRIPLADVSTDGIIDAAQLAQMAAAVSPEETTQ